MEDLGGRVQPNRSTSPEDRNAISRDNQIKQQNGDIGFSIAGCRCHARVAMRITRGGRTWRHSWPRKRGPWRPAHSVASAVTRGDSPHALFLNEESAGPRANPLGEAWWRLPHQEEQAPRPSKRCTDRRPADARMRK